MKDPTPFSLGVGGTSGSHQGPKKQERLANETGGSTDSTHSYKSLHWQSSSGTLLDFKAAHSWHMIVFLQSIFNPKAYVGGGKGGEDVISLSLCQLQFVWPYTYSESCTKNHPWQVTMVMR